MIHLIYSSTARPELRESDLMSILSKARACNARLGITGILLHSGHSFFQVLEGEPDAVDGLFKRICSDSRHEGVTVIIREPIARRSFLDWSMGFASLPMEDVERITGCNDIFAPGSALFQNLNPGRARKLLTAFLEGRWRARLDEPPAVPSLSGMTQAVEKRPEFSFAFQPIVDIPSGSVFSYEALIRGAGDEPASHVLGRVPAGELHDFDEKARVRAIELAARLGLDRRLNLNVLPRALDRSDTAITSVLEAASRHGLRVEQIVLEVLECESIPDLDRFVRSINATRQAGYKTAIDDFGAGHAGLHLLAEFQPDMIKLDMDLVRHIERKGPRQAIVRGIVRTCFDLGIDIIAEGVETSAEYEWLRREGIELFQGQLFAAPAFERFPEVTFPA